MEFEQHGEDRAAYEEMPLKNLETSIKKKSLTERRFRDFRRLCSVYQQLGTAVTHYLSTIPVRPNNLLINNVLVIRQMSAELKDGQIRRASASL